MTIRDAAGKEREIPVRFEITSTPDQLGERL